MFPRTTARKLRRLQERRRPRPQGCAGNLAIVEGHSPIRKKLVSFMTLSRNNYEISWLCGTYGFFNGPAAIRFYTQFA